MDDEQLFDEEWLAMERLLDRHVRPWAPHALVLEFEQCMPHGLLGLADFAIVVRETVLEDLQSGAALAPAAGREAVAVDDWLDIVNEMAALSAAAEAAFDLIYCK